MKRPASRIIGTAIGVVLMPALFFVLLEAGLRMGGYGVNTDFVLETDDPKPMCYLNADAAQRYFSPALRSIQPSIGFRIFDRKKAPGTLRVFVLGESTVAGFPFHVNGSFAGFLEDDLRATYPDRKIEVIDCGMSAISSYVVLDFAKQLVRYEPDLFLVYLGHNEFYGTLGAASSNPASAARPVTLLQMNLAKLRTYQLVRNGIFKMRGKAAKKNAAPGRSLMAAMIGEKKIRMGDRVHQVAEHDFRANLTDIIEVAQEHKVPIIVSTLTSNLRDMPPFASAHQDTARVRRNARIEAALGSGNLAELETAVALDTTYAAARFVLARVLEADTTQIERARREYIGARDHDVIHFRACTPFNNIIRDVATAHDVPLVDMDAIFAAQTPRRSPGRNVFLEHLHPNLKGAILMAFAFHDAMEQNGIIPAAPAMPRSFEQMLSDACITPLDLELARQRIVSMTAQWPFQQVYGSSGEFPKAPAPVEQMARRVLEKRVDLATAHEALGREYLAAHDLPRALEEYRALAKIYPVSPAGPINTADILLELQRPAEAIPYYRDGLALDPGSVETRYHLALAYQFVGDTRAAREECNRVLAIDPNHAATRRLQQQLGGAGG